MSLLTLAKGAAALTMALLVRSTMIPISGTPAALVIGEGAYAHAPAAATAVPDAKLIAAALKDAGFEVDAVYDLDRAGMDAEVARFSANLKPGQPVLIYYSGLAAKAPAANRAEGLDNYLLPIDAAPASQADLPKSGIALTRVLEALSAAQASAQVIVIDAARANLLEQRWGGAPGLTEPTSPILHNAYIAFPTGPGRVTREGSGPNSLFAVELDKGLRRGGVSANQMFTDISQAVEAASGGAQSPWFSGSGGSARWVMNHNPPTSRAADDLKAYNDAIACGTEACLNGAAGKLADAKLVADLRRRAEMVGGSTDFDPMAAAPAARTASGLPPFVDDFIAANQSTPGGMSQIGQGFLNGSGGFPKDDVQAFKWLGQAAANGDAKAAYLVGWFWETGRPPTGGVDRSRALPFFRQAAEQNEINAQYQMGLYYYHGYGGLLADRVQGAQWIAKAASGGQEDAKEIFFGHRAP